MAEHSNPLTHVADHPNLEIPWWNPPTFERLVPLPEIPGLGFQITRFMVMELIAALLMAAILIPTVRHIAKTRLSRGRFYNAFEALLLFIRDDIARPSIGGHAADRFLPFLWTVFFFVLFSNLLGMIPGGAAATGNVNVTSVLALMTLGTVIQAGTREMGVVGFWVGMVPHIDVPWWLYRPLWLLLFGIEVVGLFIRHVVLAIRLFANMFAGHIVLSVILGFILMTRFLQWEFFLITPLSLVGVLLLTLLELFVACLQAYIFTFLSALFIGSALHPH
jgi:F-type H+-transporting ATPase subunit a